MFGPVSKKELVSIFKVDFLVSSCARFVKPQQIPCGSANVLATELGPVLTHWPGGERLAAGELAEITMDKTRAKANTQTDELPEYVVSPCSFLGWMFTA